MLRIKNLSKQLPKQLIQSLSSITTKHTRNILKKENRHMSTLKETFKLPEELQEKVNRTKSPWTIESEFKVTQKIINDMTPLEKQCAGTINGADISEGAQSPLSYLSQQTGYNLTSLALQGLDLTEKNIIDNHNNPVRSFGSSGEGGFNTYPSASQAVRHLILPSQFQLGSGGIGVIFQVINLCNKLKLKLQQIAKKDRGGSVYLVKLLKNYIISMRRGIIPEGLTENEFTEYAEMIDRLAKILNINMSYDSPEALVDSIEELKQLLELFIEVNPNLNSVGFKIGAGDDMATDIASLTRMLYTFGTSTEERTERLNNGTFQLRLGIAGKGGGTGKTERNAIRLGTRSVLGGLMAWLRTTSDTDRLDRFIIPELDGMLYRGDQLAMLYLVRHLATPGNTIPVQFGIGLHSLIIGSGCINLRKCHEPDGCTVGVASLNPNFIPNFDGSPAKLTAGIADLSITMADTLSKFGISDLNNMPEPTEVLKIIQEIQPNSYDPDEIDRRFPEFKNIVKNQGYSVNEATVSFSNPLPGPDNYAKNFFGPNQSGIHSFAAGGDYIGAISPKDFDCTVNGGVQAYALKYGEGTLSAKFVGDRAAESSRHGARLMTIVAGHSCGRLAMGSKISVCAAGAKLGEISRTLDLNIFGRPEDFPEFANGCEISKGLTTTFGQYFGQLSTNLQAILPKIAKKNHAEFIHETMRFSELTDQDCNTLLWELKIIPIIQLQVRSGWMNFV